ncbi:hypothetical protein ASG49_05600 [Marmoricola sp. Leaf446]|uniref:hypothetical protein n=1 Tax=Marmoricola sp. Leaf446 TaxID=1736379 RepID=UPI0006F3D8D6|nr:hypothetical protein [Marmoricola sp. Leaf446]KQT94356.1 hypothetical protein ASG49_05600 [Marmoricola sp. Leaf446]
MTPRRARQLLLVAAAGTTATGFVMLMVMLWAGERSSEVGGMDGAGYGWTAVLLLLAGLPTLVLGSVAWLLLRRPATAGTLCSLGGVVVLFGGSAAFGMLAGVLGVLAGAVGIALIGLGVVGGHDWTPAR